MDLLVGVDRADRVGADHLDVRVLLAQVARHPGDRAARPHAHHEMRHAAAGLAPHLRPGGEVVRLRVGGVGVLVGLEGARDLAGQPVRRAVVALRGVRVDVGRRHHDLGAVGAQQVDLLPRHLVRHHRDHAVALDPRRDRQARAGVARRRLDDRPAGLQAAVALRGLHEAHRHAVLDRAAGVEVLDLGDDLGCQARADAREADQRGVPDGVEDGVLDVGFEALSGGHRRQL